MMPMPANKPFIDTNVLIYLLSADAKKADRAEEIILVGGNVSVQVLNELANVALRQLAMPWPEINDVLSLIRSVCPVEPLTVDTHDRGCHVAERYKLSVYDSMIVAAALIAGCNTLYSEDMQDGLLIDNQVRILNPFKSQFK
jgi:predicted nucleic acid-binding protein